MSTNASDRAQTRTEAARLLVRVRESPNLAEDLCASFLAHAFRRGYAKGCAARRTGHTGQVYAARVKGGEPRADVIS